MDDLIVANQIDSSHIRKEWFDGECYYSVIDVVALLLDTDHKHAKTYYHVLKGRKRLNGVIIPSVKMAKIAASDGKKYLTEFMDKQGIQILQNWITPNYEARKTRINYRKADEVVNFHPKVIDYMKTEGFQIQHHVQLPSGSIIDIIACSENKTYVIECKPQLNKGSLYLAIGQVLCYRNEYNVDSIPAIATYNTQVTRYSLVQCHTLGIEIIEIH